MKTLVNAAAIAVIPFLAGGAAFAEKMADDVFVVKGAELAATPMAAWWYGEELRVAGGDEAVAKVPASAVRYSVQSVPWPTATVKVLSFSSEGGGVLHPITDETLLYVKQGEVLATVGGDTVTLRTGDVASMPDGVLASPDKPAAATVVAWTVSSLIPGATPAVVRAEEADASAAGGGRLQIRRYDFPGNSVRAPRLTQGLVTSPNTAPTDSLVYITSGSLRFFQDGREFQVQAGDFIRQVAHLMHNWDVTEDSAFVTTSALPIGAGPIDPSEATDVQR